MGLIAEPIRSTTSRGLGFYVLLHGNWGFSGLGSFYSGSFQELPMYGRGRFLMSLTLAQLNPN